MYSEPAPVLAWDGDARPTSKYWALWPAPGQVFPGVHGLGQAHQLDGTGPHAHKVCVLVDVRRKSGIDLDIFRTELYEEE